MEQRSIYAQIADRTDGTVSVAVVQVLIWAVLVCGAGAAVMPHVSFCDNLVKYKKRIFWMYKK